MFFYKGPSALKNVCARVVGCSLLSSRVDLAISAALETSERFDKKGIFCEYFAWNIIKVSVVLVLP